MLQRSFSNFELVPSRYRRELRGTPKARDPKSAGAQKRGAPKARGPMPCPMRKSVTTDDGKKTGDLSIGTPEVIFKKVTFASAKLLPPQLLSPLNFCLPTPNTRFQSPTLGFSKEQ